MDFPRHETASIDDSVQRCWRHGLKRSAWLWAWSAVCAFGVLCPVCPYSSNKLRCWAPMYSCQVRYCSIVYSCPNLSTRCLSRCSMPVWPCLHRAIRMKWSRLHQILQCVRMNPWVLLSGTLSRLSLPYNRSVFEPARPSLSLSIFVYDSWRAWLSNAVYTES